MNTIHLIGIRGIQQQFEWTPEDNATAVLSACHTPHADDTRLSKDGGAFAALTNAVTTVDSTMGTMNKVTLTAAECGCRRAVIHGSDAAGGPDFKDFQVIIDFTPFDYGDAIYVDGTNGTDSTDFPHGASKRFPCKTLANAMTIADATKTMHIKLLAGHTDYDFAGAVTKRYTFEAEGGHACYPVVRFSTKNVANCTFIGLQVKTINEGGSNCRFVRCQISLGNTELGTSAIVENCEFLTDFRPENGSKFINCWNKSVGYFKVDELTAGQSLDIINFKGVLQIQILQYAATINIYGGGGKLAIPSNNVAGTINVFGTGWDLQDDSGDNCTVNNYEADLSQLHGAGSWIAGGTSIRDNYRKKNATYDSNGNPTYYEEHIFGSAADAANDTNATKVIGVWNTYTVDANSVNKYKLTAQLKKDVTP